MSQDSRYAITVKAVKNKLQRECLEVQCTFNIKIGFSTFVPVEPQLMVTLLLCALLFCPFKTPIHQFLKKSQFGHPGFTAKKFQPVQSFTILPFLYGY